MTNSPRMATTTMAMVTPMATWVLGVPSVPGSSSVPSSSSFSSSPSVPSSSSGLAEGKGGRREGGKEGEGMIVREICKGNN